MSYLVHHGIKGQKWGVRRWQNEDGSVTPAGAIRYYGHDVNKAKENLSSAKEHLKQETKIFNKNTGHGSWVSEKDAKRLELAKKKEKWAKEDLSTEKAKEALSKETKISKHRQKLEEKYRAKGMSEEEAAVAAYKRAKTEKILAIAGGVAVASLAAYGAYKYSQFAKDQTIAMGTKLSRIAQDGSTGDLHEGFYAVLDKNKVDKARYGGIYGLQLKSRGADIFRKTIDVNDQIKVASPKNQIKVLQSIANENPSYKRSLLAQFKNMQGAMLPGLNATPKQAAAVEKAIKSLQKGKIDNNVREALNLGLMDHNSDGYKYFVSGLKKAGYGAVKDVNDSKLSGFATKNPLIIFEAGKTAVSKVEHLTTEQMAKENAVANGANLMKQMVPSLGIKIGAISAAAAGVKALGNKAESNQTNAAVKKYRQDHPNTELSNTEIARILEEEKLKT